MSSLTAKDKMYLEKLLQMQGGYVLGFSDRTMGEFFLDSLNINIYDEQYNQASGSKANRIRGFWRVADDGLVGRSILELLDFIQTKIVIGEYPGEDFSPRLVDECREVAIRLLGSTRSDNAKDAEVKGFMQAEFVDIAVSIEALESDIHAVITQRLDEIRQILTVAPLASVLLIGSTLEGLLLDVASKNRELFLKSKSAPKLKGRVRPLDDWTLEHLIVVSYEVGYISRNVRDFSQAIRGFRNYIHPREQARQNFHPDADTATICLQVLKAAITELAKLKTTSTAGTPGTPK